MDASIIFLFCQTKNEIGAKERKNNKSSDY